MDHGAGRSGRWGWDYTGTSPTHSAGLRAGGSGPSHPNAHQRLRVCTAGNCSLYLRRRQEQRVCKIYFCMLVLEEQQPG